MQYFIIGFVSKGLLVRKRLAYLQAEKLSRNEKFIQSDSSLDFSL